MHLASRAFENGGRIPGRFTCDGDNEMPPLELTGVPPEARSLALVCSDPDAPSGTFHHWAVYDIPPDVRHLPERTCAGMREAVNDFGGTGYGGPCPPRGHGSHRYCFRLYALDIPTLGLGPKARCREVERLAHQHALAEADLIGLYARD